MPGSVSHHERGFVPTDLGLNDLADDNGVVTCLEDMLYFAFEISDRRIEHRRTGYFEREAELAETIAVRRSGLEKLLQDFSIFFRHEVDGKRAPFLEHVERVGAVAHTEHHPGRFHRALRQPASGKSVIRILVFHADDVEAVRDFTQNLFFGFFIQMILSIL